MAKWQMHGGFRASGLRVADAGWDRAGRIENEDDDDDEGD